MLKIRRPLGRLIFNMGIAIPGKTVFLIETAPRPLGGLTALVKIVVIAMLHAISYHIELSYKGNQQDPVSLFINLIWILQASVHSLQ